MANPAAKSAVNDASIAPLRVALLNSPAGELPASLIEQDFVEFVANEGNSLGELLLQSIEQLQLGLCVRLSFKLESHKQAILMLPALTAAKLKCHPHAVWVGLGNSLESALSAAKRKAEDLSLELNSESLELQCNSLGEANTITLQLSLLSELIAALHSRNLSTISAINSASPSSVNKNNINKANYWFTPPHKARVASLQLSNGKLASAGGKTACTLVLTQGTSQAEAKPLIDEQRLLFVISGETHGELTRSLEGLSSELDHLTAELEHLSPSEHTEKMLTLMQTWLNVYLSQADKPYALVLQASSSAALSVEINGMLKTLPELFANQKGQYKTPAGSYFTPAPVGQAGLTFVYPGVGTVYPQMLSRLHEYFPALYTRLEREGNLSDMLQAHKTYGASAEEMSLSELAIAGVGSSYLLTKLLTQEFKVHPSFALGYSMGEAAMWASLDVWQAPHALIEATQTSPIFTTAISGELSAVRHAWQLKADEQIVWNSFVVRCAPEPIEALLPEFPRAYLAIVQGDTCVIAGCESSCRELLKKLTKRGIAANRVTAMHTPPALRQHKQVLDFYNQPLTTSAAASASFGEAQGPIQFISAANNQSVLNPTTGKLDSQAIAQSIADTFCHRLDFTALIQSCTAQGAKLFIEVGADRQTSTLIDKINKANGQALDTSTVPMNAKGGDDASNLLKALAQLISHRVPLSLTPLTDGLNKAQLTARIRVEHSGQVPVPSQISEGELT